MTRSDARLLLVSVYFYFQPALSFVVESPKIIKTVLISISAPKHIHIFTNSNSCMTCSRFRSFFEQVSNRSYNSPHFEREVISIKLVSWLAPYVATKNVHEFFISNG